MLDTARIAAEFGLGRPLSVSPLRRLATPLAVAAEAGTRPLAWPAARYQAVVTLLDSWRQLHGDRSAPGT